MEYITTIAGLTLKISSGHQSMDDMVQAAPVDITVHCTVYPGDAGRSSGHPDTWYEGFPPSVCIERVLTNEPCEFHGDWIPLLIMQVGTDITLMLTKEQEDAIKDRILAIEPECV